MPIQPGTDIGRYHILEQLGEGGMAIVYKAYDTRLDTDIAIKVIRTGSLPPDSLPRVLKRFQIEAKKMAQLNHPNIVKVMDYGEFEGIPFLVMPFIPGGTLKQKLGKPIPWREAIKTILPIADALFYAHELGLIHRDIKPSNILITQLGQPMVSDFGVAKVLENQDTLDLTTGSMYVGTPEYMAPEQGMNMPIDQRVDIYALGVVFYEMVIGRKPYQADTPLAVLLKSNSEPLPRPTSFVADLPEMVEHVLLKALAKKPDDRFQNMSEFSHALEKLSHDSNATLFKEVKAIGTKNFFLKIFAILSLFGIIIYGNFTGWNFFSLRLSQEKNQETFASATPKQLPTQLGTSVITTQKQSPTTTIIPIVAYACEFNTPGDLEGWGKDHYGYNEIESIEVKEGFLNFVAYGSDPFINSPCCLNIQAEEAKIIQIAMKVTAKGNSYGEIYFITSADGAWNESKVIRFQVYPSNEIRLYKISMIGNSNWKGTITAFRLDPSVKPAEFQIDYILITSS